MNINMEEKKVCVIGLGGVGGYVGGLLAKKYPHVSFIVRGSRKESIQNNGLNVKSDLMGDFNVMPDVAEDAADELGIMDYIFICVKNYSLEQACEQIAPMVGENTVVVPIMNGINPCERTRKYLGKGIVLDALIYIVSGSEEDFTVVQKGDYASVHIGLKNPTDKEKQEIENVHDLLNAVGLECVAEEDIEAAIWKKYIMNCAFNIITAYYSATTGELRGDAKKAEEFKLLTYEACLVARTMGVKIPDSMEEDILNRFLYLQPDGATSSLRRDMDNGKPNELETFSGYLLELAEQCGLNIPITKQFYSVLKRR